MECDESSRISRYEDAMLRLHADNMQLGMPMSLTPENLATGWRHMTHAFKQGAATARPVGDQCRLFLSPNEAS